MNEQEKLSKFTEVNEEAERHNKIFKALYNVKADLESKGFNVVAIYMQGSQNYKLDIYSDDYQSDIDMKAFIIPSKMDLYYNKMKSEPYITEYGIVEVKDIRLFVELIKKANLTYLELLCTEYKIVDERLDKILEGMADVIVKDRKLVFLNALRGTAKMKHAGVLKSTKATQHIIEKYGYQPKELHHLARLYILAVDMFIKGKKLSDSYVPEPYQRSMLKSIKDGSLFGTNAEHAKEEADAILEAVDTLINPLLDKAGKINESSIEKIDNAVFELFCKFL